jgi:CsoR family transcriptional regulator, copper-sensing transcriptional repressor
MDSPLLLTTAAPGEALPEQHSTIHRPCAGYHVNYMKIQDQEVKHKLISRLRRIEGQIRGVETMVVEDRDCQEIMQQLAAINSAMQAASRVFLQDYATACLMDMDDEIQSKPEMLKKREKLVADMLALFVKAP